MKSNLSLKNIKDFQPGDSLYLHLQGLTLEAEFIAFENGKITAKVLESTTNNSTYKHRIAQGWIETVKLHACSLFGQEPNGERAFHHYFDPLGYAIYESPEQRHLRVPENHPSYGMVSISRVSSSGPVTCFGSPILHNHTMRLRVHSASLKRSLHEDRYFAGNQFIEVEMTPQQFTDMLTSPNTQGTPVTIKYLNKEEVGPTPFLSKLDQFETELKEKVRATHSDTKRKMGNIAEILQAGKPIGKKDKEHIMDLIDSINMEVESNFPFLQSQMIEEMGRVVGEAKASIGYFLSEQRKALGLPESVSMPILLEAQTKDKPNQKIEP